MIKLSMEKQLSDLYNAFAGHLPEEIVPIAASGSNRHYFRLGPAPTVIGTSGTSREENEAFIYLCKDFDAKGLPVPKILAVSSDRMCYLQSDLGNVSLFDIISKRSDRNVWDDETMQLIETTVRLLPAIQWLGGHGIDYSKCYPVAEMDRRSVMWDLNYFKYCFLKATGIEFREEMLEDEFEKFAELLLSENYETFMFRDFQSRNVMITNDMPHFIDFQGGRRGPWQYDIVSFLWQAKAGFPRWLREKMIEIYLDAASGFSEIDREKFYRDLPYFILFRTLQVLGAYGFRGYVEHKPHFLQSIPMAIGNLTELLKQDLPQLPYLTRLLKEMTKLEQFKPIEKPNCLVVKVASFGYNRHGIPSDTSGNGGGFVFDCRALHNPGRYDQYKRLTGLDPSVIEFLEKESSIGSFLDEAYSMVDNSVSTYIARGFDSLMVSFGCTGGQHRSVYCAEHMAQHLRKQFPEIIVELTHFELGKKLTLQ